MATTSRVERTRPGGIRDDAANAQPSNPGSLPEIVPEVYEELRRLAAAYLRGERAAHTLQATALVHEAYLRLQRKRRSSGKTHATLSRSLRA